MQTQWQSLREQRNRSWDAKRKRIDAKTLSSLSNSNPLAFDLPSFRFRGRGISFSPKSAPLSTWSSCCAASIRFSLLLSPSSFALFLCPPDGSAPFAPFASFEKVVNFEIHRRLFWEV